MSFNVLHKKRAGVSMKFANPFKLQKKEEKGESKIRNKNSSGCKFGPVKGVSSLGNNGLN